MPWKTSVCVCVGGGGGEAQSNFPTRDHQNIFNLILIWSFFCWKYLGGTGTPAPIGATAINYHISHHL